MKNGEFPKILEHSPKKFNKISFYSIGAKKCGAPAS